MMGMIGVVGIGVVLWVSGVLTRSIVIFGFCVVGGCMGVVGSEMLM